MSDKLNDILNILQNTIQEHSRKIKNIELKVEKMEEDILFLQENLKKSFKYLEKIADLL